MQMWSFVWRGRETHHILLLNHKVFHEGTWKIPWNNKAKMLMTGRNWAYFQLITSIPWSKGMTQSWLDKLHWTKMTQLYSKNQTQLVYLSQWELPSHIRDWTLKRSMKSNHYCSNSTSWLITMKYLTTKSHTYLIVHLQSDGIITLEKKKNKMPRI